MSLQSILRDHLFLKRFQQIFLSLNRLYVKALISELHHRPGYNFPISSLICFKLVGPHFRIFKIAIFASLEVSICLFDGSIQFPRFFGASLSLCEPLFCLSVSFYVRLPLSKSMGKNCPFLGFAKLLFLYWPLP